MEEKERRVCVRSKLIKVELDVDITEYYLALKRKEVLQYTTVWVDLQDIAG